MAPTDFGGGVCQGVECARLAGAGLADQADKRISRHRDGSALCPRGFERSVRMSPICLYTKVAFLVQVWEDACSPVVREKVAQPTKFRIYGAYSVSVGCVAQSKLLTF